MGPLLFDLLKSRFFMLSFVISFYCFLLNLCQICVSVHRLQNFLHISVILSASVRQVFERPLVKTIKLQFFSEVSVLPLFWFEGFEYLFGVKLLSFRAVLFLLKFCLFLLV